MKSDVRVGTVAALCALGSVLAAAPAHAEPLGCPGSAIVEGSACSARLTSVSAHDFTLTGTPVGGQTPSTFSGAAEAYLPSTGFVGTPPGPVQEWDATIARVTALDPSDPNWYGNGKARAFLPVQLNQLAAQFPPDTLMVRFVPDDSTPGVFRLVSVQPVG